LRPTNPVVRHEHEHPGDLAHLDTKKLGRIGAGGGKALRRSPAMRDQDSSDLNSRLDAMSAAVEWVTARLDSLD